MGVFISRSQGNMLGRICAVVVILMSGTAPAWAASCVDPIPPVAISGGNASEQQMKDAHDDVMNFIKSSDDYQSCLLADLGDQREKAAKAKDPKPLDPAIEQGVQARIEANQRMKEKVGAEFNAAVLAYKSKHSKG